MILFFSRFLARAGFLAGALVVGVVTPEAQASSRAPFPLMLLPLPGLITGSQPADDRTLAYAPRTVTPETETPDEQPSRFRRQNVSYDSREAPGTVVVDTANTYLYLVLGNGRAMRYGIGVGRDGFTWSGVQSITRKAEWPNWTPPADMLARQPYLPRFMAGGPGNPLGARAMYLGGTVYRIHGTNDPTTIGQRVSSGCIRLTNDDVTDLYSRIQVGTRVVVLPTERRALAGNAPRT